jgi:hypothetical protein
VYLITGFCDLHEKGVPITLDICGASSLHDDLVELVKDNRLPGTVTFKRKIDYDVFLRVLTEYKASIAKPEWRAAQSAV